MSWLWKSDASSTASFEKALSKLSAQITSASVSLEKSRAQSRRFKALWTLYTTLAYLVCLLILVLVIGPQNWSVPHYGGLLGSPALIYLVRLSLTTIFDWQIGRKQTYLQQLQKQRESKIADLKKATKYDSTQELLQKYGGGEPKESKPPTSPQSKQKTTAPREQHARTGLPPPPTANIQARPTVPLQQAPQEHHSPLPPSPQSPADRYQPEEPGFAPNAFSAPPPSRAVYEQTPHWYDRILDVMLGEDETQAKNRLVLLCHNCRLVNGQAPPGVKTLEELGRWRCANCGAWNGHEMEASKVVEEIQNKGKRSTSLELDSPVPQTETGEMQDQEIAEDKARGTGMEQDAGLTKRVTRSSTGAATLESL